MSFEMEHDHFIRQYCNTFTAFVVIHMQCCEQCVVWQPLSTVALSCSMPVCAAAPASLCCLTSTGQSCPFAGSCLAAHSKHLLAAHLLLPSQLRHCRSHGFWTASCVVPFSRKSLLIRPFLYRVCLKLSNELISCCGGNQGNEQQVHIALLS